MTTPQSEQSSPERSDHQGDEPITLTQDHELTETPTRDAVEVNHALDQALSDTITISPTVDDSQRSLMQMPATEAATQPPLDERALPDWSSLIGHQLGGCRVDRVIGAGGMGVVFEGTHLTLNTKVAIKCLPPHQAPAARDRFALEARVTAKFSHPNIVQVMHAGEERGLSFIVMELVRGESIADKLKRRGALSIEESLECCLDVCRALTYAERQGVVHRDIKPANILVDQDGGVKLADLGLVKLLDQDLLEVNAPASSSSDPQLTRQGAAMGTPHYMAPEQIKDAQSVDHHADIYALGCTLFHMLCGAPPFSSRDIYKLFTLHLSAPRPQANTINPNVPRELSRLIERMMAIDPQARPANASAIEREILSLFDGWSTLPNSIKLSKRHQRERLTHHMRSLDQAQKKTRWLGWSVALLGGALLMTLLWVFTLTGQDAHHPAQDDSLSLSGGAGEAEKLNTLLWIAESARHQSAKMAQKALSGELRLIAEPKHATDHYWNARIFRNDHKLIKASSELWLAFRKGLRQHDLIEELGANLTEAIGPIAALQQMRVYQEEINHKGLTLWVQTRSLKLSDLLPSGAETSQRMIDVLTPLIEGPSPYLPALSQFFEWIDTVDAQRSIPLLERIEIKLKYMSIIERALKIENRQRLKLFYISIDQTHQFTRGLEEVIAARAVLAKTHREPIMTMSSIMGTSMVLTFMPSPHIHHRVKRLTQQILEPTHPLTERLSKSCTLTDDPAEALTQPQLRASLSSVVFSTHQRLHDYGGLPITNLTLHPKSKRLIAFEIEDFEGLKSYTTRCVDVDQIRLKHLRSFHRSLEWYESISAPTYLLLLKHQVGDGYGYFYNIPLLRANSDLITAMRFQVSHADGRVIFEREARRERFSEFNAASPLNIAPHAPESLTVRLELTLSNQEVIEISAPFAKLVLDPSSR